MQRRELLAGVPSFAFAMPALVRAQELDGFSSRDQTASFEALLRAVPASGEIVLPRGRFHVTDLALTDNLVLSGVPGQTQLSGTLRLADRRNIVLRQLGFTSTASQAVAISNSEDIAFALCQFDTIAGEALNLYASGVSVTQSQFSACADAAIHAVDSLELLISGNRIDDCGNAGVRIWRNTAGRDGAIVTGNRISNIDWRAGGNGQNGNGINVFRADEVTVSNNHISDCAFTAVRLNTTRNAIVTGNQCHACGEVAIFSEFGFSGSVIAQNIVDGAATGISITNLDSEGALAVCANNIVRNIAPQSLVNPDTIPIGIHAEADTAITGNVIENVPGTAISVGWGPFLRNVSVTGNLVRKAEIGINVSVAEGAGSVTIAGNQIDADQEIVGSAWMDVVESDLEEAAEKYPQLSID